MAVTMKTTYLVLFLLLLTSCGITHSALTVNNYKVGKLTVFDACRENEIVTAWVHDDLDGSFEIRFPSKVLSALGACYVINNSIGTSNGKSNSYDRKTCNNITGTIYNPLKSDCYLENVSSNNSFQYTCDQSDKVEKIRFVRTNTVPLRYILLPFWITADIVSFPYQLWQFQELASHYGKDIYEGFFGMWFHGDEANAGCVPLPR
jgi:hypothetical protein